MMQTVFTTLLLLAGSGAEWPDYRGPERLGVYSGPRRSADRMSFQPQPLWRAAIYGLEGSILSCIDVDTGTRQWKKGRFGRGQLLVAGDEILALSESGEAVLVEAESAAYAERARFQAADDDTFAVPAISDGRLYVRSGEWLHAYQLSDETRTEIQRFRPFTERGYVHVNAHQLSPDGDTLYLALFPERVAATRGEPLPEGAPEVSIYVATRTNDGAWSAPEPISFAGDHKDYEPTLSPDGNLMLFNSWRPMPDGSPSAAGKNNLWLSRREADGWSEPVLLEGASKPDTEESYPSIASDKTVYYGQETLDEDGETAAYDVYVGTLSGNRLVDIEPFSPAATGAGEGDPWVSSDGTMVVFTRWEFGGDWNRTVDLYVTFRRGDTWSAPVPFPHNDPDGPDFSPTASGDGATFYWKQRDGTKMMSMRALIEAIAR